DKAAQKGTGKWTSQAAMDMGIPIPTIDSAVSMRQISAQKDTRRLITDKFSSEEVAAERDTDALLAELESALLSSYVLTYAQGLSLLQAASAEKDFGLDLAEIAKIWRGGCIIRSALLD